MERAKTKPKSLATSSRIRKMDATKDHVAQDTIDYSNLKKRDVMFGEAPNTWQVSVID